jgi:hypothetical protein
MDRLGRHYVDEARRHGIDVKVFRTFETGMAGKIGKVDALVVFTDKISHTARAHALQAARAGNIPMLLRHSCGVCAFRDCLNCLKDRPGGNGNA